MDTTTKYGSTATTSYAGDDTIEQVFNIDGPRQIPGRRFTRAYILLAMAGWIDGTIHDAPPENIDANAKATLSCVWAGANGYRPV